MLEYHREQLAALTNSDRRRVLKFPELKLRAGFFVDGTLLTRARGGFGRDFA